MARAVHKDKTPTAVRRLSEKTPQKPNEKKN